MLTVVNNTVLKKYIWLNPVITSSYDETSLIKCISEIGFEIVKPKEKHLDILLAKYKRELLNTKKPILDKRCPLIVEHYKDRMEDFKDVDIDPILIHVSKELSNRDDLMDGIKYIITPCTSLKKIGENLKLKNTVFYTWDEFVFEHNISIIGNKLENSPIPLGFFDSISNNILKVTEGQLKISKKDLKDYDIVEGLYCLNGCHNGDGVTCIKRKKR